MLDLFIKPIVTEKASNLMEKSKFVFEVNSDVNKISTQQFFSSKFGINVSVNIINLKGKKRRKGFAEGKTRDRKKAIVTALDIAAAEKIKSLF